MVLYYHFIGKLQGGITMKTAEEIIAYLQAEMDEAIEIHDSSKDLAQRYAMMLKAYTISELLDTIKK